MCEGRNLWKIPAPAVGILLAESSDTVPREDGHPYHTPCNVHGVPKHDKAAVVVPIKYGVVGYATMCVCAQLCLILCNLRNCSSSVHGLFSDINTGVGYHFLLRGIFPNRELNLFPLSPALAGGFFTTEPLGKPYATTVPVKLGIPPIKSIYILNL